MSKVVIVTGASRGIGLAIAHHLLAHAHKVVLVARTAPPLAALQAQFPQQVAFSTADYAADLDAVPAIVDLAVATFGRLDGVVINHGVLEPLSRLADADIGAWKRLYDVNLFSALALVGLLGSYALRSLTDTAQAKAAIPQLRATNGRIVLTSSGAALKGYTSWGAYGSSKAAANSLVQHLAVEEPAIASVAVGPGRVDTDMQKEIRDKGDAVMDARDYKGFVDAFEGGALNPPEKPAEVIAKLAVDAALELSGKYVK